MKRFKEFKQTLLEFSIRDLKDAVSDVTKKHIIKRGRKKSKIQKSEINEKGLTLVYHSKPTKNEARCYDVQFEKFFKDSKYIVKLNFPEIKSKEDLSKKNKSDLLNDDVKISCNCAGFYWQGFNYNASELKSSINRVSIKDDYWKKIHDGKGAICKHLHEVLNQFDKNDASSYLDDSNKS